MRIRIHNPSCQPIKLKLSVELTRGERTDLETALCWPGLETVSGEAGVSAASAYVVACGVRSPIRRRTDEKMEALEGDPDCVSGEQVCNKN
jgi:hypothetical protein